ncbi:lytic transglycosylase domain-containing protein [Microvirgula aerodenitrificans]|uniref:lytic transglycosylase domain-containing protein n=1 Tax=Microvirgula aerodenitrificans TaxID=57480 RepID=UPI00248E8293|nr:lytic transglycosylase domain-containing protein [Microvirgula aerodenitrificans]
MMTFPRLTLTTLACLAVFSLPACAGDADIVSARDAARRNDSVALDAAAAAAQNDLLAGYPQFWRLARSLDRASPTEVHGFIDRNSDGPLGEQLRLLWAKQLAKSGLWRDFAAEYAALPEAARDDEVECYALAERILDNNDKAAVATALKTRWRIGRAQSAGCETLIRTVARSGMVTDDDLWLRAQALLAADRTTAARELTAGTATPLTAAGIARPELADMSTPAGRTLRLYAIQKQMRKDITGAAAQLASLQDRLPARDVGVLWGQIGLASARKLDTIGALSYFSRADKASLSNEQWEWWARAALREGRWPTVQSVIESMPATLADNASWLYWHGRALAAQGKPGANRDYQRASDTGNGFYPLMSREELGSSSQPAQSAWKPDAREIDKVRAQPAVQRSLALLNIANSYARPEFREDAKREWRWAMRDKNDAWLLSAAEIARQANFYDMSIYSADRTRSQHDWSLRYLSPFRDVTRRYASQMGLDEAWIYGLIRQESRFVNVARSGVGASGLMQLMPATAKWVASKSGMGSYSVNDIEHNIQLGTWYLNYVYTSLGDAVRATAAYNAGPGRARAWQAERPLEGAIYAETIPFTETRDYVQKVMANAVHYASVFGHSRIALKDRLGVIPPRGGAAVANPSPSPDGN